MCVFSSNLFKLSVSPGFLLPASQGNDSTENWGHRWSTNLFLSNTEQFLRHCCSSLTKPHLHTSLNFCISIPPLPSTAQIIWLRSSSCNLCRPTSGPDQKKQAVHQLLCPSKADVIKYNHSFDWIFWSWHWYLVEKHCKTTAFYLLYVYFTLPWQQHLNVTVISTRDDVE